MTDIRNAGESEIEPLARLWYDAWHDGHAALAPPELARQRTLESFRARLRNYLPSVRVAGPAGAPIGLCLVKNDELYQLFVAAGRGSTRSAAGGASGP